MNGLTLNLGLGLEVDQTNSFSGSTIPTNSFLLEDGTPFLLEDGTYFLLEG